ncbi:hypothetical protein WJX84_000347 [Apatococcus fuscideae]|uniref:BZIP domain-containing protein n=1 Tax=Apatococcus fuscideae TaxID=2026836 RepID=A0AAW1T2J4_9CHLO
MDVNAIIRQSSVIDPPGNFPRWKVVCHSRLEFVVFFFVGKLSLRREPSDILLIATCGSRSRDLNVILEADIRTRPFHARLNFVLLTKPLPSSPPAYGRYFLDSQPYQLPYEALRDDNSHIPETGFEHRRSALPTTSGIAPQAVLASEVENTLVPGADFDSQQARHATHGQHSPETRDPEDHREKVRRSNREAQKRWRQRNKSRLRQQEQHFQLQQQELNQAQKEAEQAKAALQAALHLQELPKTSQFQGLRQDISVDCNIQTLIEQTLAPPERTLTTLGDQVRGKVDELDRIRSTALGAGPHVYDLADDITAMLHHHSSASGVESTVDSKPLMTLIGVTSLSISGQTQQIPISSIVNCPLEEFMRLKGRYVRSITALMGGVNQASNSPACLRAQQLSKEAILLTLYACFTSPKRTCRASTFNYITQDSSLEIDPTIWAACMVRCLPFSGNIDTYGLMTHQSALCL